MATTTARRPAQPSRRGRRSNEPRRLRPSERAAQQRAAEEAAQRALEPPAGPSSKRGGSLRGAPGLHLPWHRATMAHLRAAYPCHADEGFGHRGPYMGVNVSGGLGAFYFDPFELYQAGVLSDPNGIVFGRVGKGKSSFVKAFIGRELTVYGPRRFVVVLDPKGEYSPLADQLGIPVVRLHPGGSSRLNPMDVGAADDPLADSDRVDLADALVSSVLGRRLDEFERSVLRWAVETLAAQRQTFTLLDLPDAIRNPPAELIAYSGMTPLQCTTAATSLNLALDQLCRGSLAGMFDGPTTVDVDWDHSAGLVLDLSAVYGNQQALPLVMMAATTWLRGLLRRPSERRVLQVIDEAWAAVGHGAQHLQASLKLCRTYGVSTWIICHKPSDLAAQADDGTSTSKIASGLLADIQTRVLFAQDHEQAHLAGDLFGLNARETNVLELLPRGRALWQLGTRTALIHNSLSPTELVVTDTDSAMVA